MIIQPEADPAQEAVMRGFWLRLLVFVEAMGMACTASISRMIKSKKKFSKQGVKGVVLGVWPGILGYSLRSGGTSWMRKNYSTSPFGSGLS